MWFRRLRTVLSLSVLIAVAGCATAPPRPAMVAFGETGRYGYSEEQQATGRYLVRYVTPRLRVSPEDPEESEEIEAARRRAFDLALWRAAELALDNGYPAFLVRQDNRNVALAVRTEPAFSPVWPHPFYYDRFDRFHPGLFPYYPYYPYGGYRSRATARVTAELEVEMLDAPTAESYDAAETAARLRGIYGDTTYPGSD